MFKASPCGFVPLFQSVQKWNSRLCFISVEFENPSITEEDIDEQVENLGKIWRNFAPEADTFLKPAFVTCHVKSVGSGSEPGEADGRK